MAHGIEVEYKVSVSSRVPNTSTPPTVTEVGELTPVGNVSYQDALNAEGEASLSVEPERVTSAVASRLADLEANPSELTIIRDNTRVWTGPLLSCQLQGATLTLNARGLAYYMRYMTLEADLIFASPTDQYTIGKGLIDAYQDLSFGDYGIDTSGIGTAGVTRVRSYIATEGHNVFTRLQQLAEIDSGFDFWVDADDRDMNFAASRGSDKTDEVYADQSNILNPNVFWSVSQDNVASEGIAVGTSEDPSIPPVVGTKSNTTLRAAFGRVTVQIPVDGVTTQATIDDHAQRIVDARDSQLLVPGPSILPVADVLPTDFEPGDKISYSIDVGMLGQIYLEQRVRSKRVIVDENGVETMELEML